MQELVIIENGKVTVHANGKSYIDTFENFITDGGTTLPENVSALNYNRTLQSSWINGKAFQTFPNEYAESTLNSIELLIVNRETRLKQEEADRIANLPLEEKQAYELAMAKNERAEAVSKITVEVDGMTFDGDEEAQTRMGRTVAAAVALGVDLDTYTQTWVLADNTVATPTIKQLAQALKLAGEKQTELWTVPYTE